MKKSNEVIGCFNSSAAVRWPLTKGLSSLLFPHWFIG